jgi:acyl carrier protein
MLTELDDARHQRVLAPKLLGGWNLHLATRDLLLDHFVLFSSVVGSLGNVGQASYAAANAALDALARLRRSEGLPALAVAWGALGGAGILERSPRLRQHLERVGWHPLPLADAFEVLGRLLAGEPGPEVVVADIDWSTWRRAHPSLERSPVLADLVPRATEPASLPEAELTWREILQREPPVTRPAKASRLLADAVAKTIGADATRLDPNRRFDELGVDSLMVVELQTAIRAQTGVELSAMDLTQGTNCQRLAAVMLSKLAAGAGQDGRAERAP